MKKCFLLLNFLLALGCLLSFQKATPTASQLVSQMLEAGKDVQTLKFTLQKQERIKGKLTSEKANVKLQQKPFKVYLRYQTPNPGMEVLFVSGQNNNEAFIRPSSFPWTTISLNPNSSTMRSGQHHTIHEMGFSQILAITDFILKKYGKQAAGMLQTGEPVNWNNLKCYPLTLENPNFRYIEHTVGPNENVLNIATKFRLSEYMILEKNPALDDYSDVKAGQKIKIPTDYARKIWMLLDQKTGLPVVIKVYDEKGLFEQYEYHNLQVNPVIQGAEFTKTYKDYKF
ncbi:DUF1571 domain-containing protein [Adhaeribacter sp. BT258]|uniref:DUF1571 domain-containing protein n=1 Tax=Adhaeribacter terrigena TaxID=2793070 RepID=A0ABS1BYF0_9BACT|nr:DUF1571 domain-containing protein [Adhaeribacter terrigena]MBK0401932.1 DUF1571 domain-containing protein [Adhaeribacter terrigena]